MNNPPPAPEPVWRKSSYSGNNGGECIECRTDLVSVGKVPVRDSKCTDGLVLTFSTAAFSDFVRATVAGDFGTV
ncbi:DUF397 domain-containing protein [Streptomyces sp. NPDC051907]|uniref:DUF397 domain-containing protein n=1 Tax=Streptomyces sp. NPDC051907 TaxID=3155284 RepID=UPI00341D9830